METKDWVLNWFVENTDITEEEITENLNSNYFQEGWIDSFKFMNMIGDVEDEFDIEFENEEFQDREFATFNGLIKTITKKQNGKI